MARRVGCYLAGLLALAVGGPARADGHQFDGDLPAAEHVLLDLTAAQVREVGAAARHGDAWPELALTVGQRQRLRELTGVEVRWVYAVSKEELSSMCTCHTASTGVIVGRRLAVLRQGLADLLSRRDVVAVEQALVDRSLRGPGAPPVPITSFWQRGAPPPERLRGLAGLMPGHAADGTASLPKGWQAQRLRLAAVPRIDEEHLDPAGRLERLEAIEGRPSAATALRWPEAGARRAWGEAVLWLVPGTMQAEIGPPERAWFLLEYRDRRLVAAVAEAGAWLVGASYEWGDEGG